MTIVPGALGAVPSFLPDLENIATNLDDLRPADMVSNATGDDSVAISGASRIVGDIQASGKIDLDESLGAITVEGTKNLVNFVKFRRTLTSLEGVEKVQIKEMGTNTAALLVDFKGTGRKLADALKKKSFGSFGIQMIEVTATDLKLALVPG